MDNYGDWLSEQVDTGWIVYGEWLILWLHLVIEEKEQTVVTPGHRNESTVIGHMLVKTSVETVKRFCIYYRVDEALFLVKEVPPGGATCELDLKSFFVAPNQADRTVNLDAVRILS